MFEQTLTTPQIPPLLQLFIHQQETVLQPIWLKLPQPVQKIAREGVGAALMLHIIDAYGQKNWKKAKHAAALLLEGYNRQAYSQQDDVYYHFWIYQGDFWSKQLKKRGRLSHLHRCMQLMESFQKKPDSADLAFAESPLYFRFCGMMAMLAGDIPQAFQEPLDLMAFWFGLGLMQKDDPSAWSSAIQAMGLSTKISSQKDALTLCQQQLHRLPHSHFTEQLATILPTLTGFSYPSASFTGWKPIIPTVPTPPRPPSTPSQDPWRNFADQWASKIDVQMSLMVQSPAACFEAAKQRLLQAKGKRLRPLLLLAATQACGGEAQSALPLAAILEWLHQVSLLLDDIIDRSALRRNIETLHTHTSTSFAIGMSGYLATQLYSHLHSFPKNIQNNLLQSMVDLLQGQSTELRHIAQWKLDLPSYLKIIEGKTASLFSFATQAGAAIAQKPTLHKTMKEYGRLLGIAFQIIDDILDYTGDPISLGKNPGSDLQTKKISLPILLLRKDLEDKDRKILFQIFSAHKTTNDDFQWVLSKINQYSIAEQSITIAREYAQQAKDILKILPQNQATQLLRDLTTRITERSR